MKYTTAVAAAFAAGATASFSPGWGSEGGSGEAWSAPAGGEGWGSSWVTDVLTAYTTFCPEATVITHGPSTYSVTEATTLTITGPVTVTYPVTISTTASPSYSSSAPPPPPVITSTTPASPVIPPPLSTGVPPVYSVPSNGTTPAPPVASGTAPVKTTPPSPTFTGAASVVKAGSAGLAAVFGVVAFAL